MDGIIPFLLNFYLVKHMKSLSQQKQSSEPPRDLTQQFFNKIKNRYPESMGKDSSVKRETGKEKEKRDPSITAATLLEMSKANFATWQKQDAFEDAEINEDLLPETETAILSVLEFLTHQARSSERFKRDMECARFMGYLFLVALTLSVVYPFSQSRESMVDQLTSFLPYVVILFAYFVSLETKKDLINQGIFAFKEMRDTRSYRERGIRKLLYSLRFSPEYVEENFKEIAQALSTDPNIPDIDFSQPQWENPTAQRWLLALQKLNVSNEAVSSDSIGIEDLQMQFFQEAVL